MTAPAPAAPPTSPCVLGLRTPHLRSPADVDAAAALVAAAAGWPADALLASSPAAGPPKHLALVVVSPQPLPPHVLAAVTAAVGADGPSPDVEQRAAQGAADRVVLFPGREHLTGVLGVADVLARGAVEAVVGLGGLVVPDDAVVDTRDHVRPRLLGGRLVLDVQPARGGRWVPFEAPTQHACCSAH